MKNGNVSGLEGKFAMISEQSMNKTVSRVSLRARVCVYVCMCVFSTHVHACVQIRDQC